MKTFFLILILFCSQLRSETIDEVIIKLGNEDFDVREEATDYLSKYPKEYAFIFRKLSESFASTDLEVSYRLKEASDRIFYSKILTEDIRWRNSLGFIGVDTTPPNIYPRWNMEKDDYDEVGVPMQVEFVFEDKQAAGKLKEGDLILEINGVSILKLCKENYYGYFPMNSVVVLKVKRLKEQIENYDELTRFAELEGEEFEIKLDVTEREPRENQYWNLVNIYKTAYNSFLEDYRAFSYGIQKK